MMIYWDLGWDSDSGLWAVTVSTPGRQIIHQQRFTTRTEAHAYLARVQEFYDAQLER